MIIKSTAITGVILAALALPAAAGAQPPPRPNPTQPPSAVGGASAPTLAGRVEQRLNQLHAALGITADEETLWGQYADVTRANARAMSGLFAQRKAALGTLSAPDNMHSLTEIAAQHARAMQWLDAAFTALYAAMPPAQQHAADAALRAASMHARP